MWIIGHLITTGNILIIYCAQIEVNATNNLIAQGNSTTVVYAFWNSYHLPSVFPFLTEEIM